MADLVTVGLRIELASAISVTTLSDSTLTTEIDAESTTIVSETIGIAGTGTNNAALMIGESVLFAQFGTFVGFVSDVHLLVSTGTFGEATGISTILLSAIVVASSMADLVTVGLRIELASAISVTTLSDSTLTTEIDAESTTIVSETIGIAGTGTNNAALMIGESVLFAKLRTVDIIINRFNNCCHSGSYFLVTNGTGGETIDVATILFGNALFEARTSTDIMTFRAGI